LNRTKFTDCKCLHMDIYDYEIEKRLVDTYRELFDHHPPSSMKRKLNHNLPGNQVYYTFSSILLGKNVLCSNLHDRKGFNEILLSYKILTCTAGALTVQWTRFTRLLNPGSAVRMEARPVQSTPYTLHPTPYTRHPATYTMHATSCPPSLSLSLLSLSLSLSH